MRLQSLHIKGFKSFANDTIIHFNEDVIGIVGPNGSGKSNIVDAIRWVLGEQKSKELRLEQMQDVIFNGTKNRKEAPTAMVELVFSNDKNIISNEYSTVAISRTLYRSGESEYRINNVICRLKDITSLFLDTGIGSNSYAIIALGMVDDILADKDHARRKMFEQAAGISKYKSRKKETLQKLASASTDLDRVNDLLFEIEGNMKTLEKQAKRTKKYFEIKDEYKDLAVVLATRSIQSLKEAYKALNTKLTAEQDSYQKLQANFNLKEAALEKEKKKHLDKELSVSTKQKELNQLVASLRSSENERELLEQRIQFNNSNIRGAKDSIDVNKATLAHTKSEVIALEKKVVDEQNNEKKLAQEVHALHQAYQDIKNQQGAAKQLSDAKSAKTKSLQSKIYEAEKTAAIAQNNLETIEGDIQRTQDQIAVAKNEEKALQQKEKEYQNMVTAKQQELEVAKLEANTRQEKLQQLESQRDLIQEDINKINRLIDSKQNEYDLLKSMVESFEGFPESIKYLAQSWKKDVPILSDLLDVNETYRTVIEQYLEPYLNYYVVSNLSQAKDAIRMLTGAQKGKANFFLLEDIPSVDMSHKAPDRCIAAVDAVSVDMTYQGLLNYLLQDAFIFDGEMEDFIIDPVYKDKTFLSKIGSFIKTNTTISGGSVGLFEGKKIGRKKNLEKLQTLLVKNEQAKAKLYQQYEKVKVDIQHLKTTAQTNNIDQINAQLNTLLRDKAKHDAQVENFNRISEERAIRVLGSQKKREAFQQQIKQAELNRQALLEEVKQVEAEYENKGGNLDSLNDALSKASDQYNQANISLIRQQSIIQNFTKDLDYKLSRITELEKRIKDESDKLERDQKEVIDNNENLTLLNIKLQKLYEEKKGYQGNLSAAEQAYYQARNVIVRLEEEVKVLNRGLNQKQVEINQLKDQFNDVRFKISAVGDRLKIEFNININDIINNEPTDETPLDELEEKVERIKNRLANYGEINPMALQAYEEIKGRYDNITVQRQDIVEAQESLMTTIKEIEQTATRQFMESFEKVRSNFIMVFRSLFTEDDNCDLVLLDEANPLDSDIEIIAKPKGKKPRSLSQLSGGEKTLTATALLFALYLLKPAPFCIFDEVDAPLDDANIQKFNKIIKKFASESQFIIVTHNKATMAAVDVLYGVYMQEMGVSGVAPVDFRALKEMPMYESFN